MAEYKLEKSKSGISLCIDGEEYFGKIYELLNNALNVQEQINKLSYNLSYTPPSVEVRLQFWDISIYAVLYKRNDTVIYLYEILTDLIASGVEVIIGGWLPLIFQNMASDYVMAVSKNYKIVQQWSELFKENSPRILYSKHSATLVGSTHSKSLCITYSINGSTEHYATVGGFNMTGDYWDTDGHFINQHKGNYWKPGNVHDTGAILYGEAARIVREYVISLQNGENSISKSGADINKKLFDYFNIIKLTQQDKDHFEEVKKLVYRKISTTKITKKIQKRSLNISGVSIYKNRDLDRLRVVWLKKIMDLKLLTTDRWKEDSKSILNNILSLIKSASKYIYIEGYALADEDIVNTICEKLANNNNSKKQNISLIFITQHPSYDSSLFRYLNYLSFIKISLAYSLQKSPYVVISVGKSKMLNTNYRKWGEHDNDIERYIIKGDNYKMISLSKDKIMRIPLYDLKSNTYDIEYKSPVNYLFIGKESEYEILEIHTDKVFFSPIYFSRQGNDQSPNIAGGCYIHSKCMIVDDDKLLLGSANFTYRSMQIDDELDIQVENLSLVKEYRQKLWKHWDNELGNDDIAKDLAYLSREVNFIQVGPINMFDVSSKLDIPNIESRYNNALSYKSDNQFRLCCLQCSDWGISERYSSKNVTSIYESTFYNKMLHYSSYYWM
ncbi:phosphatidylserine/phosphatidylglycerophosphate/cardiolipin synthase family protein, partial [Francisella philomiragia]|uniref:phospholipase D-like domain-containing protein n=1 Tax=Francisella philomiragia TaxID=28110 RepID=UPI0019041381|nr:phospholipase D-like domain-containing protein [Francisella philomiragia]MBK2025374.1 phosphatidylserine/phosphatidylglycerophosphate/cardiolipin synthase family protein [Francisella philomiragia]